MKRTLLACVMLIFGAMLLQACGPSATPEPPTPTPTTQPSPTPTSTATATPTATPAPTATATPPPSPATPSMLDMLDWLVEHPFIVIPEDFQATVQADQVTPPFDVDDLPEGFTMTASRGSVAYLSAGEVYVVTTTYRYPYDDQVSLENNVSVSVSAYANEATREYHLGILATNRLANLLSIGENEVLSFYDQTSVGHMWISGPLAIFVGSAPPDDGNPNAWLTIFSELLLDVYPPQIN